MLISCKGKQPLPITLLVELSPCKLSTTCAGTHAGAFLFKFTASTDPSMAANQSSFIMPGEGFFLRFALSAPEPCTSEFMDLRDAPTGFSWWLSSDYQRQIARGASLQIPPSGLPSTWLTGYAPWSACTYVAGLINAILAAAFATSHPSQTIHSFGISGGATFLGVVWTVEFAAVTICPSGYLSMTVSVLHLQQGAN